MKVARECLDLSGERRVQLDELPEVVGAFLGGRGGFARQLLAMVHIGPGQRAFSIGLTGLSEEDEWCCVCSLEGEEQIEEDEGVRIPTRRHRHRIQSHPDGHNQGLCDQETWRSEEPGECLRPLTEHIRPEGVKQMKCDPVGTLGGLRQHAPFGGILEGYAGNDVVRPSGVADVDDDGLLIGELDQ